MHIDQELEAQGKRLDAQLIRINNHIAWLDKRTADNTYEQGFWTTPISELIANFYKKLTNK